MRTVDAISLRNTALAAKHALQTGRAPHIYRYATIQNIIAVCRMRGPAYTLDLQDVFPALYVWPAVGLELIRSRSGAEAIECRGDNH